MKSNSVNHGIDETKLLLRLRFDNFRFAFVRFACFFLHNHAHGTYTMPLWEVLPKNHPKISSINSGLFSPNITQKSKTFLSQLISVPQEKQMCTLYSICNFKIEVFTKEFIQHDFF